MDVLINDTDTHAEELDNGYHKFLNGLTPGYKNLEFTAAQHTSNERWGITTTKASLVFYPAAIEQLLSMDANELVSRYADISKYNKKDVMKAWFEYYAVTAPRGVEETYTSLPSNLEKGLEQISDMFYQLKKARENSSDSQEKLRLMILAMREAIYYDKNGESLDPNLLAAIISLVGEKNIFLTREIGVPYNVQNRFPGGKPLSWQNVGKHQQFDSVKLVLLPEEVLEVWTMFDWL